MRDLGNMVFFWIDAEKKNFKQLWVRAAIDGKRRSKPHSICDNGIGFSSVVTAKRR
jgi:nucleosome binding factor SPN SPT16 subunit